MITISLHEIIGLSLMGLALILMLALKIYGLYQASKDDEEDS